ncbi:hypothetical protein ICN84_07835 [Akkermansia glycaniphila]|uniref:hypothetical protein n=1 Tax=Akkermansia glycaniphila TaxID=1679444 RepID=UPI001C017784|nr:hypothetical protein [Akkermansia glycaniphila]MBT9449983.1 hypothetical protein [Akkermansia glycaniphila]
MNEDTFEEDYKAYVTRRRAHLAAHITTETIAYLEAEYQTNLPCFQGDRGTYDPLDAMKRDAQREVVLWLKNEIEQHEKQQQKNNQ